MTDSQASLQQLASEGVRAMEECQYHELVEKNAQPLMLFFNDRVYTMLMRATPEMYEPYSNPLVEVIAAEVNGGNGVQLMRGEFDRVIFNGVVYEASKIDVSKTPQVQQAGFDYLEQEEEYLAAGPMQRPPQYPDPEAILNQPPNPYPQLAPPVPAAQVATPQVEQHAVVGEPQQAIGAQPDRLQYGFDMKPEERVGFQFRVPPRDGVDRQRGPLAAHQQQYLFYLVALGMKVVNRELRVKDFPAVTEALHRKFRGELWDNVVYRERGWNAIHSRVTRNKGYPEFVQRVLGEGQKQY